MWEFSCKSDVYAVAAAPPPYTVQTLSVKVTQVRVTVRLHWQFFDAKKDLSLFHQVFILPYVSDFPGKSHKVQNQSKSHGMFWGGSFSLSKGYQLLTPHLHCCRPGACSALPKFWAAAPKGCKGPKLHAAAAAAWYLLLLNFRERTDGVQGSQ